MKNFDYTSLIFWLCFCTVLHSYSQRAVFGVVKDVYSFTPINLATITGSGGSVCISDRKGQFELTEFQGHTLQIHALGYLPKIVSVPTANTALNIVLEPENKPINSEGKYLIQRVIHSMKLEPITSFLKDYEWKGYQRLLLTATADSLATDSHAKKSNPNPIESAREQTYKGLINRQHLFMTEKITRYQSNGRSIVQTVEGLKMAGFKRPIYEYAGFEWHSYALTANPYHLFQNKYKSPLNPKNQESYTFSVQDTLQWNNHKIIALRFHPKPNEPKDACLEGVLFIDAENSELARVFLRVTGVIDIGIDHQCYWEPLLKHWIPLQNTLLIQKGKRQKPLQILGRTIEFDEEDKNDNRFTRAKTASDFSFLLLREHFFPIKKNTQELPFVDVQVLKEAESQPDAFWEQYRSSPLDFRDKNTYLALDSIATARKIEQKIRLGRKVFNGYFPIGLVDVDLRQLLTYNNYEGFRIGTGGITNELFSDKYRVESYGAFGLKDRRFKFSMGGAMRLEHIFNSWLGGAYTDDLREVASTLFITDKRSYSLFDTRPINLNTFYHWQNWKAYFETQCIPRVNTTIQASYSSITPFFDYQFDHNGKRYTQFNAALWSVACQWNPFSYLLETPYNRIEMARHYPRFTLQWTQTLPWADTEFIRFNKFDARIEYEFAHYDGAKTFVFIESGIANGDVPITHLYNATPNSLSRDKLLQRLTIAGNNSFETMYFNEFFSDRYVYLQWKYQLKRKPLFDGFEPVFVFAHRMAWGSLNHPEKHLDFPFQTMEKGYFESGVECNQLFKGFGLSFTYRYGPYSLPHFEDNLAIKFSFFLDIGI
ncbi:MAG: hypothetical protein CFE24_10620 [Flavobacterium sp. BFFFF2]|nr:MAG: hypothetical protein CFE24_10620 [Flavobacterium sp. BFFFF2]